MLLCKFDLSLEAPQQGVEVAQYRFIFSALRSLFLFPPPMCLLVDLHQNWRRNKTLTTLVSPLLRCRDVYFALEECLGEYDRDWSKCQTEVLKLKQCYNESKSKSSKP